MSVLPYLGKSENANLRQEDPGYHGHHRLLSVEGFKLYSDEADLFLKAAEERSRKILDYNGKNQNEYSTMDVTTKEGTRCSANRAFVKLATSRKNLEILDHGLDSTILFRNETFYGTELIRNKNKRGPCFLRIVHASIIPFLFAHPVLTAYMVEEKAADLIRKHYGDL
ncbi:hypothetical protein ILUMI_19451 [Ignelater luminosus]|uniref:Uncharacterized protein n=1 Tax=Ignelater luminosus TaxID=2038154 RepID=A0A8K0G382_IGNLU|nr:hypothetical protein ILUMI_19451 [Ignelater luminosus]